MNVTASIVTYGDRPIAPVAESLPLEWEVLIWDNGAGELARRSANEVVWETIATDLPDLAVYGRYAALEYASNEIIYVQDDDCIVSNPAEIAAAANGLRLPADLAGTPGHLFDAIVCNMPQEFRHSFYEEHALSGFGAAFPKHLPGRTFVWFKDRAEIADDLFNRACDIVFTGLTQRVLVDVPVRSLDYASDPNRMWKQPNHQSERAEVLEIVKSLAHDASKQMWEVPGE